MILDGTGFSINFTCGTSKIIHFFVKAKESVPCNTNRLLTLLRSNRSYRIKNTIFQLKFVNHKQIVTFATHGGLAHLARALAWQARGDRFESGILHCV
jgi:hypothetical protein